MTAVALALVHAVHAVGGTVTLDGGRVRLWSPEPLSPFLLASLRQHKLLLLAYLAEQAANGNQPADGPISRPRCRQRQRPRSSLARGRRDDFAPVAGNYDEDDEGLDFLVGVEDGARDEPRRESRRAERCVVGGALTLALDAATYEGSVAVIRDGRGLAVRTVAMRGETEERLMPAVLAALAEADVGMAMGGGTDLARQVGDIILLGSTSWKIRRIEPGRRYARSTTTLARSATSTGSGRRRRSTSSCAWRRVRPSAGAAARAPAAARSLANHSNGRQIGRSRSTPPGGAARRQPGGPPRTPPPLAANRALARWGAAAPPAAWR